jgi:hypothetical protein
MFLKFKFDQLFPMHNLDRMEFRSAKILGLPCMVPTLKALILMYSLYCAMRDNSVMIFIEKFRLSYFEKF